MVQQSTSPPVAPAGRYSPIPVPRPTELHLLRRMTAGYSRRDLAQLREAGGRYRWFERQLRPTSIPYPYEHTLADFYPDRLKHARDKWATVFAGDKQAWEYSTELASWQMLHRIHSPRQAHESLIDLWLNFFYIPGEDDVSWAWRAHYDRTIRTHALGTFEQLLTQVTLHPAMLLYLNTYESTAEKPNENHGRELLELHTVGRLAGYTEADVKNAAKVLTGWTVDAWASWDRRYDPGRHHVGPVQVMGWRHANGSADGRPVVTSLLHYLAHHPRTARTVARLMAVRFVSDRPSVGLVNDLAQVYLQHGTAIRPVLRALVHHPEFLAATGKKVRTPVEDVVATTRALGIRPTKPPAGEWGAFAHGMVWACQGNGPGAWTMPDGPPDTKDAWLSPGRLLGSFATHYNMAGQWFASEGTAVYRDVRSWVPLTRMRLDDWTDHLCRVVLGYPAGPVLKTAVRQAVGVDAGWSVTRADVEPWWFARVMSTILDSPHFLQR